MRTFHHRKRKNSNSTSSHLPFVVTKPANLVKYENKKLFNFFLYLFVAN